jgi:hypothetical protein
MHSPLVRVRVSAVLQTEPTCPSSISLILVTRLGPPLETLSTPAVSTSHPPPHWGCTGEYTRVASAFAAAAMGMLYIPTSIVATPF